ncbi:MAG: aminotransferase class I/II-fold pyridoxal phosphate-dependent enzyme [Treponema sp.]|jgi:aspartate/methionine/tyrosine aminotransferase|nr:aminotransferase class I/II-fold pyridoxal phosphate-dependent enzyme [Treponema sp.]
MNGLAKELNSLLDGTCAGRLLSRLGRRFYFPKGIIAQAAEAKISAHRVNATIGMAYQGGKPLILSAIADSMPTLSAEEAVAYAPTAGVEKVRQVWKDLIIQKNPSIGPDKISLPVVVPGLTAGISYTADLFVEEGSAVLASDPCWDNYSLIFQERRNGRLIGIPFFGAGSGLDMETIRRAVEEAAKTGSVRIILNFPNNPSGYSPTQAEAEAFTALILKTAQGGADVLVICDDAYFGHFYEENIYKESFFACLASLHDRVLAVKIDGPIKEEYVWGLRMGFLTFGSRGLGTEHYDALIRKVMGAIRSSVSCANTPAQYFILNALEDKRSAVEKEQFQDILKQRYRAVKSFIRRNGGHPALEALPFNSGYFMSFRCRGINAETLRTELLAQHGIGTVSLGDHYLRIAFAGIDEEKIPETYRTIYQTAAAVLEKQGSPQKAEVLF